MSGVLAIEILGGAAALALLVSLWARPANLFAVLFALVVVGAAIVVSWRDVDQHRRQQAWAAAQPRQQSQQNSAAATMPPANQPNPGS